MRQPNRRKKPRVDHRSHAIMGNHLRVLEPYPIARPSVARRSRGIQAGGAV